MQLHWLPVRQRIEFKLAVSVYKAMNGLSPQYLADDCQITSTAGRRRLRSANVATCEVPRTCTSLGDRSFTVAGLRLWNNLPLLHLRDSEHTFLEFRLLRKTRLFCWGQRRLLRFECRINLHLHYITFYMTVTLWGYFVLHVSGQFRPGRVENFLIFYPPGFRLECYITLRTVTATETEIRSDKGARWACIINSYKSC